jgi:hypothetical protein
MRRNYSTVTEVPLTPTQSGRSGFSIQTLTPVDFSIGGVGKVGGGVGSLGGASVGGGGGGVAGGADSVGCDSGGEEASGLDGGGETSSGGEL